VGPVLAGVLTAYIGIKIGVEETPAMFCGLLVAYLMWPKDRRGKR
jgi:hypothetical protein